MLEEISGGYFPTSSSKQGRIRADEIDQGLIESGLGNL